MDNLNIDVEDILKFRRELVKFDPAVKKALDKANRESAAPLLGYAKSLVPSAAEAPMSGWAKWNWNRIGTYSAADIQKGLKVKQRGKSRGSSFFSILQLRNESAAGAIYELAGRKNAPVGARGIQFIKNLQRWKPVQVKGVSRLIWPAAIEYGDDFQRAVIKNYEIAKKAFEAKV